MANEISILRAGSALADTAFALIEEYYEAVGVLVRDDRAALEHYLASPESPIWVALVDGAPAGCVMLRPLGPIEGADDSADGGAYGGAYEVKRLWVRPQFRGHGLAHRLMQAAEEHARLAGRQWLYLDTKDDLEAAIRFYLGTGYEHCPRYNDNPQATIFMRKRL